MQILGCGSLVDGTYKVADCAKSLSYICQMPVLLSSKVSSVSKKVLTNQVKLPKLVKETEKWPETYPVKPLVESVIEETIENATSNEK